jgi:hypothetical protein
VLTRMMIQVVIISVSIFPVRRAETFVKLPDNPTGAQAKWPAMKINQLVVLCSPGVSANGKSLPFLTKRILYGYRATSYHIVLRI